MAFKPQSVRIQGVETNTRINANGARRKQEQVNENRETGFRSFLQLYMEQGFCSLTTFLEECFGLWQFSRALLIAVIKFILL